MRIGVLASGRGSNLQALLDAASSRSLGAEIAVVLSDRSDAAALDRARSQDVPAVHVDPGSRRARLRPEVEEQFIACLRVHRVDWLVLAGFFRILGGPLLEAFPDRIVNVHPSLLPAFPGLHAQRQALEHGVRVSGCTIHLVDRGVDSGAILAQQVVEVRGTDTEETLSARILEQEHEVLVSTVRRIADVGFVLEDRRVRWNDEERESVS